LGGRVFGVRRSSSYSLSPDSGPQAAPTSSPPPPPSTPTFTSSPPSPPSPPSRHPITSILSTAPLPPSPTPGASHRRSSTGDRRVLERAPRETSRRSTSSLSDAGGVRSWATVRSALDPDLHRRHYDFDHGTPPSGLARLDAIAPRPPRRSTTAGHGPASTLVDIATDGCDERDLVATDW